MADITVQVSSAGLLSYGTSTWGSFTYGGDQQPSITVQAGTEAFTTAGWGSDTWSAELWGISGMNASVSGIQLTTSSGEKETWGQDTWNASSTEWGGPSVTDVAIGQEITETGFGLTTATGSVGVTTATEIFLSSNPLNALSISQGTVDAEPDAMASGVSLSASLGTVVAQNEQGWGRDDWGVEVWGAEGIWATCTPTGVSSSITLGNEDTDISVNVLLSAQSIPGWGSGVGWGQQKWNQASVDMAMSSSSGTVDPAPDTALTGVQATVSLGVEVVSADANLTLSGIALSLALGNEDAVPNTQVDISGIAMSFTLQGAVAGASALVLPTGVTSTFTQGIIGLNAWELVDSGAAPTWKLVA